MVSGGFLLPSIQVFTSLWETRFDRISTGIHTGQFVALIATIKLYNRQTANLI